MLKPHTELEAYMEMEALDQDGADEELYYYYDHETNFEKLRQRDMTGTGHEMLKHYLVELLGWLYRAEKWAVYAELNFYETADQNETPLYPDVALLKNQSWQYLNSYQIDVTGPAPDLVIEIISTDSRSRDLVSKPNRYEKWKTAEYFAYDPRPRQRRKQGPRLWGWRLNQSGKYEVLSADREGRIWSEELQAWLVPDELYVRLYNRAGQLLLTKAEAGQAAKEAAWAKLRELGIDPETL